MDYQELRSKGVCLPILFFLANRPEQGFSGYEIAQLLGARSSLVYISLVLLQQSGLVESEWMYSERYTQHPQRHYRITREGLVAVEQLNS